MDKEPLREKLTSSIDGLRKLLPVYGKAEDLEKDIKALSVRYKRLSDELEKLKLKKKGLIENREALAADLEQLGDVEIRLTNCQQEIKQLETVLIQLVELQNQLAKYKELQAECNSLQKLFEKTQDEYTAINMDYLEKETAFFREQAGIMAATLEGGKPCPVCGSTTHPNKAVPTADAPSEEELKSLKEKVDISRKIWKEPVTNQQRS